MVSAPRPFCVFPDESAPTPAAQAELVCLTDAMRQRRRQAFRPGTRKNHKTQLRSYFIFCEYFDFTPVDPDADTLCMYLECLANSLKAPASIKNYFSAVGLLHNLLGVECEALSSFSVTLMLRSIKLTSDHIPQKKLPVSTELLLAVVATFDNSAVSLTLKCAILLGFFSFLRRSNLVPSSQGSFDKHKNLCRGDVFTENGNLFLWIKWSKTLQAHERLVLIPIAPIPDHPLCPVKAYEDMVAAIPGTGNIPLFIVPQSGTLKPLTSSMLTKAFKHAVSQVGHDQHCYSIHSLRRGGATFAFDCQVEPLLIKTHGDWRSSAYLEYISFPVETRLSVTQQMASACHNVPF